MTHCKDGSKLSDCRGIWRVEYSVNSVIVENRGDFDREVGLPVSDLDPWRAADIFDAWLEVLGQLWEATNPARTL